MIVMMNKNPNLHNDITIGRELLHITNRGGSGSRGGGGGGGAEGADEVDTIEQGYSSVCLTIGLKRCTRDMLPASQASVLSRLGASYCLDRSLYAGALPVDRSQYESDELDAPLFTVLVAVCR